LPARPDQSVVAAQCFAEKVAITFSRARRIARRERRKRTGRDTWPPNGRTCVVRGSGLCAGLPTPHQWFPSCARPTDPAPPSCAPMVSCAWVSRPRTPQLCAGLPTPHPMARFGDRPQHDSQRPLILIGGCENINEFAR
jgi:hypothetical protein